MQPVLEELVKWQVPISLDTRRTAVMQQALVHGYADIINDVSALGDEGAIGLLAQQAHTGICLMHMQGMPETMQQSPSYQDVAEEVLRYLNERVAACEAAGIARARLVLDQQAGHQGGVPVPMVWRDKGVGLQIAGQPEVHQRGQVVRAEGSDHGDSFQWGRAAVPGRRVIF